MGAKVVGRKAPLLLAVLVLTACFWNLLFYYNEVGGGFGFFSAQSESQQHRVCTALGERQQNRTIVMYWAGKWPAEHSAFSYYYEIFVALQANERVVSMCGRDHDNNNNSNSNSNNNMSECYAGADEFVVAIPHMESSKVWSLSAAIPRISRELSSLPCHAGGAPVTLVFFLNKAYIGLRKKISHIKDIWHHQRIDHSVIFTWSPHAGRLTKKFGLPFVFVPFGVNYEKFHNSTNVAFERRSCDMFVHWDANRWRYELRKDIDKLLPKMSHEWAIMNPNVSLPEEDYIQAIADCRLHVSTIGAPGRFDLIGTRYYEVMASGTSLLLAQRARRGNPVYSQLGIIEDENIVMFSSVREFKEKVKFYLAHPDESRRIITNAEMWARNATWENRASFIVSTILEHSCPREFTDR